MSVTPTNITISWFGLFPVRSPLLRKSIVFFLFLRVLRCFSSPGYLLIDYIFTYGYLSITLSEFPHSEICGSMDMCSLPQLIAACHVLLRLPVPRHPPCALCCLTNSPILALCIGLFLLFFTLVKSLLDFSHTIDFRNRYPLFFNRKTDIFDFRCLLLLFYI